MRLSPKHQRVRGLSGAIRIGRASAGSDCEG
jgi:hypothetical protein